MREPFFVQVSAERAQALAELAKDIGGDFQILSLLGSMLGTKFRM